MPPLSNGVRARPQVPATGASSKEMATCSSGGKVNGTTDSPRPVRRTRPSDNNDYCFKKFIARSKSNGKVLNLDKDEADFKDKWASTMS